MVIYQKALEQAYAGRLPLRQDGYLEVPTALFVTKLDLKMPPLPELALYTLDNGKPKLLRAKSQPYSALALSQLPFVLVESSDAKILHAYAESRMLAAATGSPSGEPIPMEKRMESLRKAAVHVVEDLFSNPSPENITRSTKVVGSFVYLLMRDPNAYLFLTKLGSHDPYTLQHSVGTAIHAIILAKKSGIKDESELLEVGHAGLLHDVGKVKVRTEIINKPGPLDEAEWAEMRMHSTFSYDLIKDHPVISLRTKLAVFEHHEDKTGRGYPQGLGWESVTHFAKVVCLTDIFNALTTTRSYSHARSPFEAFALIKDKMLHKVDDELFKNLVLIYGGNLDKI